jgi:hypothetical protein
MILHNKSSTTDSITHKLSVQSHSGYHPDVMNRSHILQLHKPKQSSSPFDNSFPLPNELLDIVLGHLVHDNIDSPHDILSFLVACRTCNRAEFQKYIYHTVCFIPSQEALEVPKSIAEHPERAKLVKALVYKDGVPIRLERSTLKAAGLSH